VLGGGTQSCLYERGAGFNSQELTRYTCGNGFYTDSIPQAKSWFYNSDRGCATNTGRWQLFKWVRSPCVEYCHPLLLSREERHARILRLVLLQFISLLILSRRAWRTDRLPHSLCQTDHLSSSPRQSKRPSVSCHPSSSCPQS
jgi:hypothetical protein